MMHKKKTLLILSLVVLATLAGAGGFYAAEHLHQVQPAPHQEPEETAQKEAVHEEEGHDHEAEGSDLDRPVEEMWTASCEHGILQHLSENL